MGIEKKIKKLLSQPTEMAIDDLRAVLAYVGYHVVGIRGSHYHFKKPAKPPIIVPVHRGKVTKCYVREIGLIVQNELNLYGHEVPKIHLYVRRYK